MKIAVIVAMEKEFRQLRTLLADASEEDFGGTKFVCGNMAGNEVVMMQCGIGKVNAAIGTTRMILHYSPDLVISTGVAGGADVSMNVMDVVVSTECVYHDVYCGKECQFGQIMGQPARFVSPADVVEKASKIKHEGGEIHAGLIVTGDWFVDSKEKMQSILDKFPEAKAVDMESCSIAQTCHACGVPFVSFRIISDIPLKDTDASQYFDFWERMAEGSFEVTKNFLETF